MLEKPFGPHGHDRDHDAPARPSSRSGAAGGAADALDAGDGLGDESGDWELPEWVDGLGEEELDFASPAEAPPEPQTEGLAAVRRALAALDAAERGEHPPEERPKASVAAPPASEAQPALGDDAWGLDQEIETGMSWLMDLGEAGGGEGAGSGARWLKSAGAAAAVPSSRGRSGGRLVVFLLLAGAVYGGYRVYESFRGAAPETPIARPTPPMNPRHAPLPEVAPGDTGPVEAPDSGLDLAEGPAERSEGDEPLTTRPLGNRNPYASLTDTGNGLRSDGGAVYLLTQFSAGAPPAAANPREESAVAASERETREQLLAASDLVLLPKINLPVREANSADLAMIWSGSTIPLDAIDKNKRLLTPAVGRVRVVLHGGELFDGRLYAVGEQKVWLEMNEGRMALVSWQIERIEHIETPDGAPSLGEKGSQRYVGLERVRVRTAGGVFYGSLLNREGDDVTILTEDGARIMLQNARVEPAGTSRSRLVDSTGIEEASAPAPDAAAPVAEKPAKPAKSKSARPTREPAKKPAKASKPPPEPTEDD